jgi:uncharacterized protein (DUF433 family)
MSNYAITLSSQTYELIEQLAQRTQQTIDQVVSDLVLQPTKHIVSRPGVQGGSPCIRGTRVPVWVLASIHKQGDTPEDILEMYSNLTAAQVYAALSYYYEHRAEIDAEIAVQNVEHERFRSAARDG